MKQLSCKKYKKCIDKRQLPDLAIMKQVNSHMHDISISS